jgi:predicted DsbA family dithiol-disulfide isomerase
VEVRWHPFFIRPANVGKRGPEGVVAGTQGTPAGAYWSWAVEPARKYGLDMSGGIDKFPDGIYYHRILYWAEKQGGWKVQHNLSGLLFKAFYSDCVFLGPENLARLAGEAGLDPNAALAYLRSDMDKDEVMKQAQQFVNEGVSGAPTFYINGKAKFSGAQEPRVFVQALLSA